jgi:hypothetical protein
MAGKIVQLLKEVRPDLKRVTVIFNAEHWFWKASTGRVHNQGETVRVKDGFGIPGGSRS